MAFRSPEEELKALDEAIASAKDRIERSGGFAKLHEVAASEGNEAAAMLEDYENLRARKEIVAQQVQGFTTPAEGC